MHPDDFDEPSWVFPLHDTLPARLLRRATPSPEYGVLTIGIAFWIVAGALGFGRHLLSLITAHV